MPFAVVLKRKLSLHVFFHVWVTAPILPSHAFLPSILMMLLSNVTLILDPSTNSISLKISQDVYNDSDRIHVKLLSFIWLNNDTAA